MLHGLGVLLLLLVTALYLSKADNLLTDLAALVAFLSAVGGRSLSLWDPSTNPSPLYLACRPVLFHEAEGGLPYPASSLSPTTPSPTTPPAAPSPSSSTPSLPLFPRISYPLSSLCNLYLLSNHFSGPFPTSILSLPNLVRLDLSYDHFSGPIPDSLTELPPVSAGLVGGYGSDVTAGKELWVSQRGRCSQLAFCRRCSNVTN